MFDPLPDDLAAALEHARDRLGAFGAVRYQAEVESTNDVALALVEAGADDGVSVLADAQRRGRGRRGHEWFSPPDVGMYLSVIVRGDGDGGMPPLLTLGAGVALAEAIIATSGLPVELKWPNDLVIGRPWRKVGGVLAESAAAAGKQPAAVVGIGLNVRQAVLPAPLIGRASSLESELGRAIDRVPVIIEVLARVADVVSQLRARRSDTVLARWRALAAGGFGQPVTWRDGRGVHRGVATGVSADGALLIEADGRLETIIAGTVEWEAQRGA